MREIAEFQEHFPSVSSYWRAIILFGRNVASYKFALAKTLLEILPTGKSSITLRELAKPFALHICEHLKNSSKQSTSNSSQFLQACGKYNAGEISLGDLCLITEKKGFNNVIDAFHIVNNQEIPISFYQKDYTEEKKIILTDDVFSIQDTPFFQDLIFETEARWNLVETAWSLNLSPSLISVVYEENKQALFLKNEYRHRKNVTPARHVLNGYQKGKCFYCFDDISICENDISFFCDVDHFFPHALNQFYRNINWNGIWNLVLACPSSLSDSRPAPISLKNVIISAISMFEGGFCEC